MQKKSEAPQTGAFQYQRIEVMGFYESAEGKGIGRKKAYGQLS